MSLKGPDISIEDIQKLYDEVKKGSSKPDLMYLEVPGLGLFTLRSNGENLLNGKVALEGDMEHLRRFLVLNDPKLPK